MPREHQIDPVRRCHVDPHRVMAEEYLGVAGRNRSQGGAEIRRFPPKVVHTYHPKPGRTGPQSAVRIAQHADALRAKRVRNLLRIHPKIVVT
jgi:hypothetical protein